MGHTRKPPRDLDFIGGIVHGIGFVAFIVFFAFMVVFAMSGLGSLSEHY